MPLALVKSNGGIMMKDYSKMSKQAGKTDAEFEKKKEELPKEESPSKESVVLAENIINGFIEGIGKTEKTGPLKAIVVKCKRLNVRKTPGKNSEILCVIDEGTIVEIDQTPSDPDFDDFDDWAHVIVRLERDVIGYVMGEYLKEV